MSRKAMERNQDTQSARTDVQPPTDPGISVGANIPQTYALEALEGVVAFNFPYPQGSQFTVNTSEERDKFLDFRVQRGEKMVNAFRLLTPHAALESATSLEVEGRDAGLPASQSEEQQAFNAANASRAELEAEADRRDLTVKGTGKDGYVTIEDYRAALSK
jgi:hypothetical protein